MPPSRWPPAARAVGGPAAGPDYRRSGGGPDCDSDGPLADRLLVSEQLRADIRVTEAFESVGLGPNGINIPGAPSARGPDRAPAGPAPGGPNRAALPDLRSNRNSYRRALPIFKCRALELQSKTSHRENQRMSVLKNLHLPVNLWYLMILIALLHLVKTCCSQT